MTRSNFAGRRILVVEDEFILAAHICMQIKDYGGVVIGPAPTLARGHTLLQTEPQPDGGILDIRIGEQLIYPLADRLMGAGVPIVFASSESKASIPDTYAAVPLHSKPVNMMLIAQQLFPAFQVPFAAGFMTSPGRVRVPRDDGHPSQLIVGSDSTR